MDDLNAAIAALDVGAFLNELDAVSDALSLLAREPDDQAAADAARQALLAKITPVAEAIRLLPIFRLDA